MTDDQRRAALTRIRDTIQSRGLSIGQVGMESGAGCCTMQRIMNVGFGHCATDPQIEKVCAYLGLSVDR